MTAVGTADTASVEAPTVDDGKIACELCGERVHVIEAHLKSAHPEMALHDYKTSYPKAALFSEKAQNILNEKRRREVESKPVVAEEENQFSIERKPLHELFGLGAAPAAMNIKGSPIPVQFVTAPADLAIYVPEKDPKYVFSIDLLKTVMMGMEGNFNTLLWGHMGTGKSTIVEQVCAHTGRPVLRVQHTRNTEESHILGQWIVRNGQTEFQLGPLPFCMIHGIVYQADEYDFAQPAVLSVYQAVLEGKPLVIKEADAAHRVIRAHPMFRFVATGNTNGTGDDTGLYAGTLIQNAANYERFAIVEEVRYPERKIEVGIITEQGGIPVESAEMMVDFATMVRESFANGKIGLPISPRSLINAAQIGRRRASLSAGLRLAYMNRLSRIDREVTMEIIGRFAL